MKNLILFLLVTLTFSLGSKAYAAKEVFERTKIHVNVGTIGDADAASLTLAIALAAGETAEQAIDKRTGTVTALVETAACEYEITGSTDGGLAGAKAEDAYFVKVDRSTMTQTREHILLARQVGARAVAVFLDVDATANPEETDVLLAALKETLLEAGYSGSNSGVVAGSIDLALAGEKEGMMALVDLLDTLDRCMGY